MRRLPSVATLLGFGVCVLLVAGPAAAAGRVAALVPQLRPSAAPELRDRFHEAVTRGLQTGADEVVPAAEVRLRLGASEELLNCGGTGPCVARATQALRIERAVASEIEISGKDYTIKLRLIDSAGRELAKADEPCDICTVKEADEAVAKAAAKLAAAAKALPGETPPPATVETAPPPPKTQPPPPPKVTPPPETPPPAAEVPPVVKEKKPFPWRPVAIASLVGGVVGLAVGIPLLAIDGRPTCDLPDPKRSCPEVYNTKGGGAAMLTFGIGGAIASGVLFYFDHRARKKPRPTVGIVPLEGGVYVTTGGQF